MYYKFSQIFTLSIGHTVCGLKRPCWFRSSEQPVCNDTNLVIGDKALQQLYTYYQ